MLPKEASSTGWKFHWIGIIMPLTYTSSLAAQSFFLKKSGYILISRSFHSVQEEQRSKRTSAHPEEDQFPRQVFTYIQYYWQGLRSVSNKATISSQGNFKSITLLCSLLHVSTGKHIPTRHLESALSSSVYFFFMRMLISDSSGVALYD